MKWGRSLPLSISISLCIPLQLTPFCATQFPVRVSKSIWSTLVTVAHTLPQAHTHVRTPAKLHCPAAYWVCNLAQVKLWNSFHFLSLATNSTSQRANDSRATLSVPLSCPPSLTLWFINFLMNKRIIDWQGMKNGIGKGRMGEQGSVACFVVCFLPFLALPGLCCFTLRTMRRMSNVVCLPRVELSLPQLPSAAST